MSKIIGKLLIIAGLSLSIGALIVTDDVSEKVGLGMGGMAVAFLGRVIDTYEWFG